MFSKNVIAFFFLLVLGLVCFAMSVNHKTGSAEQKTSPFPTDVYTNEYGEIHLTKINDSLVRTEFYNNDGDYFDTSMTYQNSSFQKNDGLAYLKFKTGGIRIYDNRIFVTEFSSMARILQHIRIDKVYERPFFKTSDTTSISGLIVQSKGGETIDGIYTLPQTGMQNEFVRMTGIITKEKFPREYYSTPDGPQGMFTDTNKVHYRMVIKPIQTEIKSTLTYSGYPVNTEMGAGIAWEFADSELYYLYGKSAWSEKELDQKITVQGVLARDDDGRSVLYNWKIAE